MLLLFDGLVLFCEILKLFIFSLCLHLWHLKCTSPTSPVSHTVMSLSKQMEKLSCRLCSIVLVTRMNLRCSVAQKQNVKGCVAQVVDRPSRTLYLCAEQRRKFWKFGQLFILFCSSQCLWTSSTTLCVCVEIRTLTVV